MPMLSGEGAVLQQKPSGRGLDGPGPGAYSQVVVALRVTYGLTWGLLTRAMHHSHHRLPRQ